MTRLSALAGVLMAVAASVARVPAASQVPSTPAVPVVVELFTSEGCVSCPPADALLLDLVATQPVKGAVVIALGEHVDFFDQEGWKDPFSDAGFSARQMAYQKALAQPDVYTPQMIVDGTHEITGDDRSAVLNAVAKAAVTPKAAVRLAWSSDRPPRSNELRLSVTIDRSSASFDASVSLAIVEDGLTSDVTRGENKGLVLRHAAVTRRFVQIGKADRDGAFQKIVPIELKPSWQRMALHVVVLAQRGVAGRITAAGTIGVR